MPRKFDHLLVLVRERTPPDVVKAAVASSRQLLTGNEDNATFTTAPMTVLLEGKPEGLVALQRAYNGRIDIRPLNEFKADQGKRYLVSYPENVPGFLEELIQQQWFGAHPMVTPYRTTTGESLAVI